MIDTSKQDAVDAAARAIAAGTPGDPVSGRLPEIAEALAKGATHNEIALAVLALRGIR
ncbi:hypothetical protein [Streptomyces californicus]|uniref:hypothetical protein n=1 Tax=Streptomyces californicus TaxID=67351 RepID=UPI00332AB6FD